MKEKLTRQECIDRYSRLETTERMKVYDKAKSMMPEDPLGNFSVPLENIANVLDVDLLPEQPEPIHFTPGVPTEDGWYVVKCGYVGPQEILGLADDPDMQIYSTINFRNSEIYYSDETLPNFYTILSHAKLPEL